MSGMLTFEEQQLGADKRVRRSKASSLGELLPYCLAYVL